MDNHNAASGLLNDLNSAGATLRSTVERAEYLTRLGHLPPDELTELQRSIATCYRLSAACAGVLARNAEQNLKDSVPAVIKLRDELHEKGVKPTYTDNTALSTEADN